MLGLLPIPFILKKILGEVHLHILIKNFICANISQAPLIFIMEKTTDTILGGTNITAARIPPAANDVQQFVAAAKFSAEVLTYS